MAIDFAKDVGITLFNLKGKTIMKISVLVAAIVGSMLSAPVVPAQDKVAPAKPAMNMDMDKQMPQMEEKMNVMQAQMDKIHKTTDPKERQNLMQAHMLAMQENMKMMRGPMMMDGSQHGGMKMGDKKGAMVGGDMMQHHEMMEKRMDMMQMMMEQMRFF